MIVQWVRSEERMADRLSVLIVDDSRSVLAQLEGITAEFDFVNVVGTARDGGSAIRMVAELQPDLVLMDIVMPGMDGLAALRVLRANHPDVQVAMVSSVGGRPSMAIEAFRLGAIQVMGKPFDHEAMRALFESVKSIAGCEG
jgi:YesN/AraC family two-component response regulator